MAKRLQTAQRFHNSTVKHDEISPSVRIRRSWRRQHSGTQLAELVYTEALWAAANNTLVGCLEFSAWQNATQWVLVTDEGQRGDGASMLGGCEAIAGPEANILMLDVSAIEPTLAQLPLDENTMFVLAIESSSIPMFAAQMYAWLQKAANNRVGGTPAHLLWLPKGRAAQTFPIHTQLESLPWKSLTIACDFATFSDADDELKASLMTMLRAAVFIDPQFAHWLEGNLTALAEQEHVVHQKAIMRTANTLFTEKRRRSQEPNIPMPYTDSPAVQFSTASSLTTPEWKLAARQLMLDIGYATHAKCLNSSAMERIKRIMQALDLMGAAEDASLVTCADPDPEAHETAVLVLTDFGNAQILHDFDLGAWHSANR